LMSINKDMSKKIILVLYSQKFPENMLRRSEDMFSFFSSKCIKLCRGFISDFSEKDKLFQKALFFENKKWAWKENIIPDEIYDRSLFIRSKSEMDRRKIIEKNFIFYNSLKINELMSNKWLTYKNFIEYSPKSVLIENKNDLDKFKKLSSEKIILKPLFGSGGRNIKVYKKSDFRPIKFPFIVQEFLVTRKGIQGIVKGQHDLRIILANNKIIHSFVRVPLKDKFIANLSQGAKIKLILEKNLPKEVIKIAKKISKKINRVDIKGKKRLYSVDFLVSDSQRPYLLEFNSRPGIILEKEEMKVRASYYNNLINFFKK